MAQFLIDAEGLPVDAVRLVLNGEDVLQCKEYDVSVAYLQQPNAFSLTIGSGKTALELMKRWPKNTPFTLYVGKVAQFLGRTDGFTRQNPGATEIQLVGRDIMARLVDDHVEHDHSFSDATFEEIVRYAIKDAGIDGATLIYDTSAHRRAVSGTPITESVQQRVVVQKAKPAASNTDVEIANTLAKIDGRPLPFPTFEATPEVAVTKTITRIKGFRASKPIEFKAGQRQYDAVEKELKRGGLFLRAGVDPQGIDENIFLLGEPSAAQGPLYALVNQPSTGVVTVTQTRLHDTAHDRFARYIVYGQGGGGRQGRAEVRGEFVDEEMVALGYTTRWVAHDPEVKSVEHAVFLARKQCAEARRRSRTFGYAFPAHTLPLLHAPDRRAVVVPDTCIYILDEEHGIDGVFWIERANWRGTAQGGTATELILMDPRDLVFGDGAFLRNQHTKKFGANAAGKAGAGSTRRGRAR